jgi:hypothetical protein
LVYDIGKFKAAEGRFVHAKMVIAETATADHVLYGSANCTVAALGDGAAPGINVEACLYRRLAVDTVLTQLKLAALMADTELPAWKIEDDLPLADAVRRSPGRFECRFATLDWRPPSSLHDGSVIELLGSAGEMLRLQLEPVDTSAGGLRHFRMQGLAEPPAFGRLRYADGNQSGIAVVTRLDVRARPCARRETAAPKDRRAAGL